MTTITVPLPIALTEAQAIALRDYLLSVYPLQVDQPAPGEGGYITNATAVVTDKGDRIVASDGQAFMGAEL